MTDEQPDGDQWIEYIRLDDVVEAARNSKLHDLDELGVSVDGVGFISELKMDERTGLLIRGHGRLALLRRLRDRGAKVPESIRDDGDDWLVPVVRGWSSRDDAHAEAAMLADNKIGEGTGYDDRVLYDQLAHIAASPAGLLRSTGYSQQHLDDLLASVGQAPSLTPDDFGADANIGPAPWDTEEGPDPFARPTPPERDDDEQWGSTMVDPEDRKPRPAREEDGPGPLDVAPAIRTLQPWRFVHHGGGPDGAREVMEWLRGHAREIRCEDGDVVLWTDQDGDWQCLPGQWITRDGQTGKFDVWNGPEFHARFVPANEPARRVFSRAAAAKIPPPEEPAPSPGAAMLRHGSGLHIVRTDEEA